MSDETEQAWQEIQDRLLAEVIKPHSEEIARMAIDGDVAVALFEPDGPALQTFREMGWDESGPPVFALPRELYPPLAASDRVTAAWLQTPKDGVARILVFVHAGTLLLNFSAERGFWIEEGSTDAERKPASDRRPPRGRGGAVLAIALLLAVVLALLML